MSYFDWVKALGQTCDNAIFLAALQEICRKCLELNMGENATKEAVVALANFNFGEIEGKERYNYVVTLLNKATDRFLIDEGIGLDEVAREYLKLLRFRKLFEQVKPEIEFKNTSEWSFRDTFLVVEDQIAYERISYEDRRDYDPSWIRTAHAKARLFAELTGFKVESIGENHVIILDDVLTSLEEYIGQTIVNDIKSGFAAKAAAKAEAEVKAKQAEAKKRIGEAWNGKSEDAKEFLLEVFMAETDLYAHDAKVEGDYLVIPKTWFAGPVTGRTVTDYAHQQVVVLDLAAKKICESETKSRLWRTTERGVVGESYSSTIEEISVADNVMKVTFSDGVHEIKFDAGRDIFNVSPEVSGAIEARIQQKVAELTEARKNVPIRLATGGLRGGNVTASGVKFVDSTTALVSITEEIDCRPGGTNGYICSVQSRITEWRVTPDSMEIVNTITTPYE